jgi:hypothetical protein
MDGGIIFGILNLAFIVFLLIRCAILRERIHGHEYEMKVAERELRDLREVNRNMKKLREKLEKKFGDKYEKYFPEEDYEHKNYLF